MQYIQGNLGGTAEPSQGNRVRVNKGRDKNLLECCVLVRLEGKRGIQKMSGGELGHSVGIGDRTLAIRLGNL